MYMMYDKIDYEKSYIVFFNTIGSLLLKLSTPVSIKSFSYPVYIIYLY